MDVTISCNIMTELCFAIFQFYIRYAIVLHGNVFPHYGLKLHIVSFKYHSISLPSITNLKKIFLKFIPVVCNHKMYFWLPKVFYDGHNCLRLLHRPFNQTSICGLMMPAIQNVSILSVYTIYKVSY